MNFHPRCDPPTIPMGFGVCAAGWALVGDNDVVSTSTFFSLLPSIAPAAVAPSNATTRGLPTFYLPPSGFDDRFTPPSPLI